MFRLSCKLLLRFFLILLGVSLISFLLMYLAPGDPAKNMLAFRILSGYSMDDGCWESSMEIWE